MTAAPAPRPDSLWRRTACVLRFEAPNLCGTRKGRRGDHGRRFHRPVGRDAPGGGRTPGDAARGRGHRLPRLRAQRRQVNPGLKLGLSALQSRFGPEPGAAFHALGQEAPDFLAGMIRRRGLDRDLEERGMIRLAHNAPAAAALGTAADDLEAQGVALDRLPDREAVAARTGTARYVAGYVDPRGRAIRPQDLAWELARAAAAAGAVLHGQSRVTALTPEGGGWRLKTAGGPLDARQVLVATNGYTDGLIPGLAESLLPVNSFQIATAPLPPSASARILPRGETVYDSRRLVLYFRRSSDDRLVLGGRASFSSDRTAGASRPDYRQLEGVLRGIFPDLAGVPIANRWTGLVCITRDFLPHYHRPAEGLHVVLGFNGRGVAASNRAGAWIGRQIAGLPDSVALPETPIRPFPLHRWRAPMLNLAMKAQYLLDLAGR